MRLAIAIAALVSMPANASTDVLSDSELASRAATVFAVQHSPPDRILGVHRGLRVVLDERCSDVCPTYTVRIIHYDVPAFSDCARIGGDAVEIDVPVSIASMKQNFCIPHILYGRKLYVDHPYQR